MSEDNLPDWVYQHKKPQTDRKYFENLTRCIFQAGLSWQLLAKKWSGFQRAFDGFNIEKVAAYSAKDIKRLTNDSSIIRNRQKILATIHNAQEFQIISHNAGSFQQWLGSIDKSNNYDLVVKRLNTRFKRVGPSTAHIFLWSVGEQIRYDPSVFTRKPTKII